MSTSNMVTGAAGTFTNPKNSVGLPQFGSQARFASTAINFGQNIKKSC